MGQVEDEINRLVNGPPISDRAVEHSGGDRDGATTTTDPDLIVVPDLPTGLEAGEGEAAVDSIDVPDVIVGPNGEGDVPVVVGEGGEEGASPTIKTDGTTPQKPYQCSECGKTFSHKGNYNDHMNRKKALKPYVCEHEGCTKAFTTNAERKKHHFRHAQNADGIVRWGGYRRRPATTA